MDAHATDKDALRYDITAWLMAGRCSWRRYAPPQGPRAIA